MLHCDLCVFFIVLRHRSFLFLFFLLM
jgi:hypothetical protein